MGARIKFRTKPDKIVETILYLAHKGIELSQYKTVKLLYLADREHFRRFGRPISFDKYVAMEYGPVASIARNIIIGKNVPGVDKNTLPFQINKIGDHFLILNPKREIRRDLFSKSDLIILDDTVEKYGRCEFGELYNLTHDHFAYSKAWNNRPTATSVADMFFEDFLAETANKEDKVQDLEFTARGM